MLAYVAVGSNIDPARHLPAALRLLADRVPVVAVATVYRTAPLGRPAQDDYRNTVWAVETTLPPRLLKPDVLRPVEAACGRVRTADRYAARTLDLDLVVYGVLVLEPDDVRRPWVALPLRELGVALPPPAGPPPEVDAALSAALRAML